MAYEFRAVGWEDYDGHRHKGTPSDLSQTHGVVALIFDPDRPEQQGHVTFYAPHFQSWAEWWLYIQSQIDMYEDNDLIEHYLMDIT